PTDRPGRSPDPPYPGRAASTARSPSRPAASATPGHSTAPDGVPWCTTSGTPSAAPPTTYSTTRPFTSSRYATGQTYCRCQHAEQTSPGMPSRRTEPVAATAPLEPND